MMTHTLKLSFNGDVVPFCSPSDLLLSSDLALAKSIRADMYSCTDSGGRSPRRARLANTNATYREKIPLDL